MRKAGRQKRDEAQTPHLRPLAGCSASPPPQHQLRARTPPTHTPRGFPGRALEARSRTRARPHLARATLGARAPEAGERVKPRDFPGLGKRAARTRGPSPRLQRSHGGGAVVVARGPQRRPSRKGPPPPAPASRAGRRGDSRETRAAGPHVRRQRREAVWRTPGLPSARPAPVWTGVRAPPASPGVCKRSSGGPGGRPRRAAAPLSPKA